MKKKMLILASFAIMLGCATQNPVPKMPNFTTDESKSCARLCQSTYANCNMACSQMIGGARTASQREQCLNNCNQTLADCYSTCK
jgi:hypothetical protein